MNPGGNSDFVGLNNGESGILRKTGIHHHHHHHHHHPATQFGQDSFADLLVFGYSCKVFRDDEKARFIDQGRHLIPWMGDNQLKIDRYDARGALHDLSQHEPPIGGYGNRIDCLPPAEQRAEQLCEEERYHSLYANEVEEEIYQEEAAKRQAAEGAEIGFNYDAPPDGTAIVGPAPADSVDGGDVEDDSDPPYVTPQNFEIPADLELPETMKEHAIIEKTAKFIASQDSQMEILLRAKQAANPQFGFLTPGGKLYRYYRHVLMAIKTNQYPEEVPEKVLDSNGTDAEPTQLAEEAEPIPEKPRVIVPAIKYKPSVDCAYTQLISKITGAPIPPESPEAPSAPLNPTQLTSLNTEFEYYPEQKPVEVKKVSTGLAGLVQYDSDSDDSGTEQPEKPEITPKAENKQEIVFTGTLPPEIFQHVIEKTATYVAKNGYNFEDALRTKDDPRFLFLRKDHEFYPYYAFRVRYLINPYEDVPKSPEKITITREIENGTVVETPSIGIKTVNTAPQPVAAPQTQIQATKPGGAVCFSIKSKDDGPVALKSNVIQELGADEEEVEPVPEKEKSKSPSPEIQQKIEEPVENEPPENDITDTPSPPLVAEEITKSVASSPEDPRRTSQDDADAKEQKRLEDRIKDKLSIAARERLAAISKEKQLQLERKKRASMFLSLINKNDAPAKDDTPPPKEPPTTAPATAGSRQLRSEFSEDEFMEEDSQQETQKTPHSDRSVHSIPSQSASPVSNQVPSSADDDVMIVEDEPDNGRRSRSRTVSRSSSRPKKRKHKHKSKTKKGKKKKSRSRSRSRSKSREVRVKRRRSRSRTPSESTERSQSRSRSTKDAKKKKKSKKKSHKRHKSSRSSSQSHNHHKERRERCEWEDDSF